jgi:hypothetical protein
VATSGRYFVGDFIGEFEPGNLVLTGPNLPHNWVSDLPPGSTIPLRGRILQFSEEFIGDLMKVMSELSGLAALLEFSRRGALFTRSTSDKIAPLMEEIATANGVRRIELFLMILGTLSRARSERPLSSPNYLPDPSGYMSAGMNKALAFIRQNLTQPFGEAELAAIAGQSQSAFSRSFRRHTGMSLVQYVKRLRINRLSDPDERRAGVHYRHLLRGRLQQSLQFQPAVLAEKGMPPSRFRRLLDVDPRAPASWVRLARALNPIFGYRSRFWLFASFPDSRIAHTTSASQRLAR